MAGTIRIAPAPSTRRCKTLPKRPTHIIAGLLKTKDALGYFAPLVPTDVASVQTVSIPGQMATLSAA